MLNTIKIIGLSILAVFAPIKAVIITSLVLIAIDLITGMLAAHKRGEVITSAALRRTVTKLAVYEFAILVAFLAETYLIGSEIPVCKIATSFVGLAELKSIFENMNELSGGSLLTALIDKLGSQNQTPKQ